MRETKKILVTGGAGYIGSHTVVALHEAGYTPIILDNFSNSEPFIVANIESIIGKPVKLYVGDCNDSAFLTSLFEQEEGIEGVIHFAAFKAVNESILYPQKYYDNNVGSLETLLVIMKSFKVNRIVFSSSCTVYGMPDDLPVTESTPFQKAETPYGHSKQLCEQILAEQKEAFAVVLRYFNPIGAHPSAKIGELPIGKPNNLIPFMTQTAATWQEKLFVFGDDYDTPDGSCVRDFIHVLDLAQSHVKALDYLQEKEQSAIFNVGTGKGHSVLELVEAFQRVNNVSLNYEVVARREGDVSEIYADTTLANRELNWQSEYSIEVALRDAWNWQKKLKKP